MYISYTWSEYAQPFEEHNKSYITVLHNAVRSPNEE